MSYDFKLFKPRAGEDPLETAQEDSDLSIAPPDPEKEATKRRIADAIIAYNPKLTIFDIDHEKIAEFEKISLAEAKLKYRYLELNGPDEDANGIQITLYDDEASVSIPFWHEGEKAEDCFREIWDYLKIICQEGSYLIYDSQLDEVYDPTTNYEAALSTYMSVSSRLEDIVHTYPLTKKPWWKFW